MINWHSIPFARMAIPIISGIVLAYYIPISVPCILIGIAVLFATYLIIHWIGFKSLKTYKKLKSLILTILCTAIGIFSLTLHFRYQPKQHFSRLKGDYLFVQIKEIKGQDAKKLNVIADVKYVLKGKVKFVTVGKIYIQISAKHDDAKPGDFILVKNETTETKERNHPWEFDFKSYLQLNGIFHQLRVYDQSFKIIQNKTFSIQRLAYSLKLSCIRILKKQLKDQSIAGLSAGLTLGYKLDVDAEMTRNFSNSGTLHLLASSGLHVGLIYLVLNFLSLPIKKFKHGILIQMLLINTMLWMYAFMTGLGPSIVRATVLFNLTGIGQILGRKKQALNLLFATACIQLVIDPLALFQIGFQLSYSAVLGILTLHPVINTIWQTDRSWLNYLKEMSSVSLSAQIFTLPITLYYFGSFPLLFLFANLLLIPLCTFLLYNILALLGLYWIKPFSIALTWGISHLTQLIFFIARHLGTENGTLSHILMTKTAALTCAFAITLIVTAVQYRSKWMLHMGMICIVTMLVFQKKATYDYWRGEASIYTLNNYKIIVCIKGAKAWVVYDKTDQKNSQKIERLLNSLNYKKELKEIRQIDLKQLFVSTNLILYPGVGLQFFDKMVTLK